MKTFLFKPQRTIIGLAILLFSLPAYANIDETEASIQKEFTETVNIGKNGSLKIEDKFGNVNISHWDRPEISYRIVVTAKGDNKNLAQRRLDGVSLVQSKTGNSLSLSTKKDIIESNKNNNNSTPTVDYYITMPSGIALELNQEFGNITLPEQNDGTCDIRIRFGNLEAGNFNKVLKLDGQFGTITFKDIKDASLNVQHCGKVKMNKGDKIKIESSFSNIEIEGDMKTVDIKNNHASTTIKSSDKVKIDANFGPVKIGKGNDVDIASNHGPVTIDYIGERLNISKLNFGALKVNEVSPSFKSIYVHGNHGSINIDIPASTSFNVKASGYKHGNCSIKGFNVTTSHVNETKGDYYYEINGGQGRLIELKSSGFTNAKISKK